MNRTIVCGDIHGCLEEFDALLEAVEYDPVKDRCILAGDLVDRGPDSVGVVRRVRELGLECVLGNHDSKYARWDNWEIKVAQGEAKRNPMTFGSDKLATYAAMSREDLEWIKALPRIIRIDTGRVVVHGGLLPHRSVEDQPKEVIMIRFVDRDKGNFIGIRSIGKVPEGSVYWSEVWTGPETVVYGHAVHSLDSPRVDRHEGYECWGLDTGCVFGGKLTAAILHEDVANVEIVQVEAKRAYSERYPAGFKFE